MKLFEYLSPSKYATLPANLTYLVYVTLKIYGKNNYLIENTKYTLQQNMNLLKHGDFICTSGFNI
jgi:hypothetical protein